MNSIYIDGKFYLNLYVYMESKKYEGTPLEVAILECKNMRQFYKLIEPQLVRNHGTTGIGGDFDGVAPGTGSFKVLHDKIIYEVSPEYEDKKYSLFRNAAKYYRNSLMWCAMKIFEIFDSSFDFDEAVVTVFREYGITTFAVESIEQSLEVDRMIEYWDNHKYKTYAAFISKLIITIYKQIK